MKTTLRLLFAFMLGVLALARPAPAADGATNVRGLLIIASKQPGETDKRLASYEANIRNMLPGGYQTFRLVGEGSASVPAGGKATLNLAQGHRVELSAEGGGRFSMRWLRGGDVLMEELRSLNSPLVLGGRASGDGGVFALLLMAN